MSWTHACQMLYSPDRLTYTSSSKQTRLHALPLGADTTRVLGMYVTAQWLLQRSAAEYEVRSSIGTLLERHVT